MRPNPHRQHRAAGRKFQASRRRRAQISSIAPPPGANFKHRAAPGANFKHCTTPGANFTYRAAAGREFHVSRRRRAQISRIAPPPGANFKHRAAAGREFQASRRAGRKFQASRRAGHKFQASHHRRARISSIALPPGAFRFGLAVSSGHLQLC